MNRHSTCSLGVCLLAVVGTLATTTAVLAEQVQVNNVSGLVQAVNNGSANDTIILAPGTYALASPLTPKNGMTITGAGAGLTTITGVNSWNPGNSDLPDNGVNASTVNRDAYLFSLDNDQRNVTISNMTLTGAKLHGAVYGNKNDGLVLSGLTIDNFLWSGVRTFSTSNARIHDNHFIDAGGRADVTSGVTGGSIYVNYIKDSVIDNNRFDRTADHPDHVYGIKGRKATNLHIHHNTINVNFSVEFPFENDENVRISNNYLAGTVSIPKFSGGAIPASGLAFEIDHNYLSKSYALEWARNASSVHHNLFDFDPSDDKGNLITNFGSAPSPGPTWFFNNLISNPGRGIISNAGVFDNFYFHNNEIRGETTITPRTEGLFGFHVDSDFDTIEIRDNIIELLGLSRPLLRNSASYDALIENNTLINISDLQKYLNANTGAHRGLIDPLYFFVGVHGEYLVNGWNLLPAPVPEPATAALLVGGTLALARRRRPPQLQPAD